MISWLKYVIRHFSFLVIRYYEYLTPQTSLDLRFLREKIFLIITGSVGGEKWPNFIILLFFQYHSRRIQALFKKLYMQFYYFLKINVNEKNMLT